MPIHRSVFPEAFKRFEQVVDISKFKSYDELRTTFSLWGGKKWTDSYLQNKALENEAWKRGFKDASMPMYFRSLHARRIVRRQISIHEGANTIEEIREYSKQGKSANEIYRELQKKGQGMRRQELLKYVRYFKNSSHKTDSDKYIPKKYRK